MSLWSVVDQYRQVDGFEGLRVADTSIMRECPHVNTNMATMMIGERVADFMRS